jgi:ABC-type proline/glycine betaine transport system ATPase subunit
LFLVNINSKYKENNFFDFNVLLLAFNKKFNIFFKGSDMEGCIEIKGARVHNLKNISLKIPRNKLVVITGVSGSGKSSLAFDTIYAEG